MKQMKFQPRGQALALEPQAFGMLFAMAEPPPPPPPRPDGAVVIDVHGPLMHHEDWCFDSYDAIKARVAAALEQTPKAIVLSIDSPGGVVSGLFDACHEIRSSCRAAKVPLLAYVENQCTSAAYALACMAQTIASPAAGVLGSIGVIDAYVDATAQDAQFGLKFTLMTSGARKSDGNPHVPTTDAAIASGTARVLELAQLFFAHVAEARPSLTPKRLAALEAGVMLAAGAVSADLIDAVSTLDQLIASALTNTKEKPAMTTAAEDKKDDDTEEKPSYSETVKSLRKMAEEDSDEGRNAKKMLAAIDAKEGDDDTESTAPPPKTKEGEEAAEDEDETKSTKSIAAQALAATERLERGMLLDSRPDFSAETRAVLVKASLEVVRDAVKNFPRTKVTPAAAAASATGTRGAGQGAPDHTTPQLPPTEAAALSARMGLSKATTGVAHSPERMTFGATVAPAPAVPAKP